STLPKRLVLTFIRTLRAVRPTILVSPARSASRPMSWGLRPWPIRSAPLPRGDPSPQIVQQTHLTGPGPRDRRRLQLDLKLVEANRRFREVQILQLALQAQV